MLPELLLKKLEGISKGQNWPFSEMQFKSARKEIPHFKLLSPSEFFIPVPYFPGDEELTGSQLTLRELWRQIPLPTGIDKKSRHAVRNIKAVHLAPGVVHKPGIRWVLIDLAVFGGIPAGKLWESKYSQYLSGPEILTVAMLVEGFIDSLDGDENSFLCLNGYMYHDPNDYQNDRVQAMYLCCGNDTGKLHIGLSSPGLGVKGWGSALVNFFDNSKDL